MRNFSLMFWNIRLMFQNIKPAMNDFGLFLRTLSLNLPALLLKMPAINPFLRIFRFETHFFVPTFHRFNIKVRIFSSNLSNMKPMFRTFILVCSALFKELEVFCNDIVYWLLTNFSYYSTLLLLKKEGFRLL